MLSTIKKCIGNNALILLIILIIVAATVFVIVLQNGKKFEKNNSNEVDADASDFIMNTVYDMAQQQSDTELTLYMNEIQQHAQQIHN